MGKIKNRDRKRLIKELDAKTREAAIIRDGNCQRCGSTEHLQLSHVEIRKYYNLRWELANVKILCAGCHLWWHGNVRAAASWFNDKFPARAAWIDELLKRPLKTWRESDLLEVLENLKQKIKELKSE